MAEDLFYDSCGAGRIHASHWKAVGEAKAVVQFVHGIAEHVQRYDEFARYLNARGIAVVAEDHMGHGRSSNGTNLRGYFHGGWFCAVEDTLKLTEKARQLYPNAPVFLFGHSMGSFMVRTILAKKPELDIAGAVICGTGWQPEALLAAAIPLSKFFCKKDGEKKPSPTLQKLMFGNYNQRVDHVRTPSDWLSRDDRIVDAYEADPLCGFVPTAGLARDMLMGISYIQKPANLAKMNKQLPCFIIAGGADPVGDYGKGVLRTVAEFKKAGMEKVAHRIYPMARHEIHNEINREEVYDDFLEWLEKLI